MLRIAILKTGSTYPAIRERFGDFEDWFVAGLTRDRKDDESHLELQTFHVVDGELPDASGEWDGIVVTGSPAMVSEREPWSETTARWLANAIEAGVPALGVCYGHQLLAHAMGGEVGYHPQGRESGSYAIRLTASASEDPLFGSLPQQFPAQLTHLQSVLALPPGAVLLASSEFEPHQAFRIGNHAWGIQFHPEFSDDVMRAYLDVQTPALRKEGLDPAQLIDEVVETPDASALLQRFVDWLASRR